MDGKEGTPSSEKKIYTEPKLLRDGYKGKFNARIADKEEFLGRLDEKLDEEALEWMSKNEKGVERDPMELADLLEVIETICSDRGRGRKITTVSLQRMSESDRELREALKTTLRNPDRDIFDGTYRELIGKWIKDHNFKDLARIYAFTLAAGDISNPPKSAHQLEELRRKKLREKGGFSLGLIADPALSEDYSNESPKTPVQNPGGLRRFFNRGNKPV